MSNFKPERLYARISDPDISEETKKEMVERLTTEEQLDMCLFIIRQMEKDTVVRDIAEKLEESEEYLPCIILE